jgi:hypothetical protein
MPWSRWSERGDGYRGGSAPASAANSSTPSCPCRNDQEVEASALAAECPLAPRPDLPHPGAPDRPWVWDSSPQTSSSRATPHGSLSLVVGPEGTGESCLSAHPCLLSHLISCLQPSSPLSNASRGQAIYLSHLWYKYRFLLIFFDTCGRLTATSAAGVAGTWSSSSARENPDQGDVAWEFREGSVLSWWWRCAF